MSSSKSSSRIHPTVDHLTHAGLSVEDATAMITAINQLHGDNLWQLLATHVLRPAHPFAVHQLLARAVFGGQPHPTLWTPTDVASTNLARFMRSGYTGPAEYEQHKTGDPQADYPLFQAATAAHPDVFWPQFLRAINFRWATPPLATLSLAPTADECTWFPGARLNIACCALDGGAPDAPAIVSAVEGSPTTLHTMTYAQLRTRAMCFAAALSTLVQPGTRCAIIMPMTPDAVVAFLGVLLARCVMVGIAESFAAPEIAARLALVDTGLVITQDVMTRGGKSIPLYQRIVQANAPTTVVSAASPVDLRPGDVLLHDLLVRADSQQHTLQNPTCDAEDCTMIMFSSGTTGQPKAIPWSHVSPLKAALDAWAHHDVRPGDVVAWPTSLGWVMGPWLVYASLLNGACMALFDGAPLGRAFGEFVVRARVTMLGLVPSIVKAWRASDCMAGLPLWQSLRCFSSTGEASAPEDHHWLMALAGYRPVIEYCGGTEIGGGFLSGTLLQPASPSTFTTPTLCTRLVLLDTRTGDVLPHSGPATGELTIVAPAVGLSQSLLNRDHAAGYYAGMPPSPWAGTWLRRHGDEVARFANGYYVALGRTDDTMNLGGIKVGSVEIERCVVRNVPAVKEAAAVGVPTPGGGPERLCLFLVLSEGTGGPSEAALLEACNAGLKGGLNPLFRVHGVLVVDSLPRNASNKVMRRALRQRLLQPGSPSKL